jgi:hypothetical protein
MVMTRLGRTMMIVAGVVLAVALLGPAAWIFVMNRVEQPAYALVTREGEIEIRDYPALVVAEVTRQGDRNSAVRAGFGPLAAYIFAKDRAGETVSMTAPVTQARERIAMTAPVTQTPAGPAAGGAVDSWRVRFIMPARYTLDTLPRAGNEDVRLLEVPAQRRAAIRFSGVATDASIAENEATLRAWLSARNLAIAGEPTYAYYNDPFTPGPLRRNEVLFDLAGP